MMLDVCRQENRCVAWELLSQQRARIAQPELIPAGGGVPFSFAAVLKQLLEAKKAANRKRCYLSSLAHYLGRFGKDREQRPIADFSTADVEVWLKQFPHDATRQTWLNRISTLFAFAVRRGWLAQNPCAMIERVTVDRRAPYILTPSQVNAVLALVPNVCRAYLVLGVFVGIRPEELLRLNWRDVDLTTRTVTVNHAKTRRRRIVPLEPRAVALLQACPLRSGPVSPSNSTVRRFKRVARVALGLKSWPSDLLRHTAASYLLALLGDAGKVATRLGNSSAVLLAHYHNPVKAEDCAKFWETGAKA